MLPLIKGFPSVLALLLTDKDGNPLHSFHHEMSVAEILQRDAFFSSLAALLVTAVWYGLARFRSPKGRKLKMPYLFRVITGVGVGLLALTFVMTFFG
jgi:hypothetical protein